MEYTVCIVIKLVYKIYMPQDQRTMYFRLSVIINAVFILGALFVMMKYQVILASKPSFVFTSPHTTAFGPTETAQTLGQRQDTQSKPIGAIVGQVTEIKDSSILLEAYGTVDSKKTVTLSINESTEYFESSFPSAGGPPKQIAIQKTDIKVGDFVSALFESQVDINTQTAFTPKTISVLPPPEVLPK